MLPLHQQFSTSLVTEEEPGAPDHTVPDLPPLLEGTRQSLYPLSSPCPLGSPPPPPTEKRGHNRNTGWEGTRGVRLQRSPAMDRKARPGCPTWDPRTHAHPHSRQLSALSTPFHQHSAPSGHLRHEVPGSGHLPASLYLYLFIWSALTTHTRWFFLCLCRSSSLSHYEVKANSSLERYDGIGPSFTCVFKVRLEGTWE